jgi:hypothetical protein
MLSNFLNRFHIFSFVLLFFSSPFEIVKAFHITAQRNFLLLKRKGSGMSDIFFPSYFPYEYTNNVILLAKTENDKMLVHVSKEMKTEGEQAQEEELCCIHTN